MSRYIDEKLAFNDLLELLELSLGRKLSKREERTVKWLAESEYGTVETLVDMLKEIAARSVSALS